MPPAAVTLQRYNRDTHAHINDNHNENDNYDGKAAYTHTHDNRATSQTHALIESMHPYAV